MASPTTETNGKVKEIFYGYMYDDPKPDEIPIPKPKPLLDALLRALALHIINDIGDKDEKHLAPAKMAAFYKLAGHDYDRLFVNMPPQSISFIYQVQGCQHMLLPTEDDFAAPSIPALTVKGFARWQAIQILLEPQVHAPIIQFAVKNWALKHPEYGSVFPDDLPATVFPADTDQDTDRWHQSCATKLRAEATTREEAKEERETPSVDPKADAFSDQKVPFSHVRPKPPVPQDYDYFNTRSGPVPVSYVRPPEPRTDRYDPRRSPERPREPERERASDPDPDPLDHIGRGRYGLPRKVFPPEEERTSRRPSFNDYPHIVPQETQSMQIPLRTDRISVPRRHSQPRHYTSPSSSDAEVEPATSRSGRRHHSRSSRDSREPPPVSHRVFNSDGIPTSRVAAMGGRSISPRSHGYSRREPPITVIPATASRADDSKRKSIGSGLKDKISNLFPGVSIVGEDRRSRSRSQKDDRATGPDRAARELYHDSRRKSYSDDESDLTESEDEIERRRRAKRLSKESRILEQRELNRERDRDLRMKSRDRDRDRDHDRDRVRDRSTRDRDRDRYRDPLDSDDLEPTTSSRSHRDRDRERSRGISTGTLRRDREHRERHEDDDDLDLSPHSSRSGRAAVATASRKGSHGSPYLAQAELERRTGSRADIRDRDWTGGSGGSMLSGRVETQDRYRDARDRERDRDRDPRDSREGRWGSRDDMRSRERPLHRDRLSSPYR